MNTKTTITVLLLAIALGVYVAVFETERFGLRGETTRQREQERAQQADEGGERLLEADRIDPARVATIRTQRGTAERGAAVFRRRADALTPWIQTEPVEFPADVAAMMDLVETAASVRYNHTIQPSEEGRSLAELGLDPPRGVVQFEGEGVEPLQLALGRRTAAGRAYLTIGAPSAGAPVYVVSSDLHDAVLEQSARDFRGEQLAAFSFGAAQRVRLERRGEPAVELIRTDGGWQFDNAATGRAATDGVRQLVAGLTEAVVVEYVEDKPASLSPFGLDEPRLLLEVEVVHTVDAGDDGEGDLVERTRAHKLKIGSPRDLAESGYFAMLDDQPVVFTLGRSDVDRLGLGGDDLRDRRLTPLGRADVRQIRIEKGDQSEGAVPLELVRRDGTWVFGKGASDFTLDSEAMDGLLEAVFEAEADAFAEATPVEQPLLATVQMRLQAADEQEVLRVYGPEQGSRLYVVRGEEQTARVLDRAEAEPLLADALALRERTVIDVRAADVSAMRISRPAPHAAEYTLERDSESSEGEWDFAGYRQGRVEEAFGELAALRAEAWLGESVELEGEPTTAVLELSAGGEHRLDVWPQQRIGRLEGESNYFRVPSALVSALAAELRETEVLPIEIDDIASVETANRTVHRDRQGRFRLGSDSEDAELYEALAARQWETLAGLEAAHFLDQVEPDEPADRSLTVITRDGRSYTIELWQREGDRPMARIDDRVMTLSKRAGEALLR